MATNKVVSRMAGQKKYTFQREKRRVPFGRGLTVEQAQSGLGGHEGGALGAADKCIRCSFGNIPVIEEVVWTIPLPLTSSEAISVFGETVNLLSGSSSVPGVASIDSTFLINGILQTDIFAQGIGVHVFCEPMSFSTIGNAFAAPAQDVATPPSPDVFTSNDIANGALGTTVTTETFGPAVFEFGNPTWRAGWNFINAYMFLWKTNQRELVMNELAADVSYFGSFADAAAAGTSEVAIIEFVAAVNAAYRSKGSATIFLPVSFRRVGSVTTDGPGSGVGNGNRGLFHPTRDFDLAPVTWGGLRWQGYGCRGQMFRPIESPCFIERGIPIGMLFQSQDAVHQALMLEALTIDNDPFGTNVSPDENLLVTTATGTAVMLEQTLDATPAYAPQVVNVSRQTFKGGILKIGIKIKGWELPGGWKAWCSENILNMVGPEAAVRN